MIEKQKNELEFIQLEQEKFKSTSYAEWVDLFKDYIEESNKKTDQHIDPITGTAVTIVNYHSKTTKGSDIYSFITITIISTNKIYNKLQLNIY